MERGNAQRSDIVQQLYLPQAEAAARERMLKGVAGEGTLPPDGGKVEGEAIAAAARASNGLASVRTLQRMAPVRQAPKTQERIPRV